MEDSDHSLLKPRLGEKIRSTSAKERISKLETSKLSKKSTSKLSTQSKTKKSSGNSSLSDKLSQLRLQSSRNSAKMGKKVSKSPGPSSLKKKKSTSPASRISSSERYEHLGETHQLKRKVNSLEHTLKSQQKLIGDFNRKMLLEKSELNSLRSRLESDKKKDYIISSLESQIKALERQEKRLEKRMGTDKRDRSPSVRSAKKRGKSRDLKISSPADKSASKLSKGKRSPKTKKYFSCSFDNSITPAGSPLRSPKSNLSPREKVSSKENTSRNPNLENQIMKMELQEIRAKNAERQEEMEREIQSLQMQLKNYMELNKSDARLKNFGLTSPRDKEMNRTQSSSQQLDYAKEIENESLKRRVAELEREVREKDLLLEERETTHLERLKRAQEKNIELERELNKQNENSMKIESLKKKLEIKENELKMNKQYYEDKIKDLKSLQKQQKKDWSKIYNELYDEIKLLKGEMEDINSYKESRNFKSSAQIDFGSGFGGTISRSREDFFNSGKMKKYEEHKYPLSRQGSKYPPPKKGSKKKFENYNKGSNFEMKDKSEEAKTVNAEKTNSNKGLNEMSTIIEKKIIQNEKFNKELCEHYGIKRFDSFMYKKLNILGKGNFGEVWKCIDIKSSEYLAVKYLCVSKDQEREKIIDNIASLIVEKTTLEKLNTLNCPHLPKFYGAFYSLDSDEEVDYLILVSEAGDFNLEELIESRKEEWDDEKAKEEWDDEKAKEDVKNKPKQEVVNRPNGEVLSQSKGVVSRPKGDMTSQPKGEPIILPKGETIKQQKGKVIGQSQGEAENQPKKKEIQIPDKYVNRRRSPYQPQEVLSFLEQISKAYVELYNLRIYHSDTKLKNLVYSKSKKGYMLIDFGGSKDIPIKSTQNQGDADEFAIGDFATVGTKVYNSPEKQKLWVIIKNLIEQTPDSEAIFNPFKCDMWSLGVCIEKMLGIEDKIYESFNHSIEYIIQGLKEADWRKRFNPINLMEAIKIVKGQDNSGIPNPEIIESKYIARLEEKRMRGEGYQALYDRFDDAILPQEKLDVVKREHDELVKSPDATNLKNKQIYLSILLRLGYAYRDVGNNQKALETFELQLNEHLRIHGNGQTENIMNIKFNIAFEKGKLGYMDEALELFKEIKKYRKKLYKTKFHPKVISVLANIAQQFDFKGNNQKALKKFLKIKAIQVKLYGTEHHIQVAFTSSNIAHQLKKKGESGKALLIFNKVYAIRRGIYKTDRHPQVATTLANIAEIWAMAGDYKQALDQYNKVLELELSIYETEKHPQVLNTLSLKAHVMIHLHKNKEALALLRKVLEIREQIYNEEHPQILTISALIALAEYKLDKDIGRAIMRLNQILDIQRKIYRSNEHPQVLNTLASISDLHYREKKYHESLNIYNNILGMILFNNEMGKKFFFSIKELRKKILIKTHPKILITKAKIQIINRKLANSKTSSTIKN